jgi:hypothetical protein
LTASSLGEDHSDIGELYVPVPIIGLEPHVLVKGVFQTGRGPEGSSTGGINMTETLIWTKSFGLVNEYGKTAVRRLVETPWARPES